MRHTSQSRFSSPWETLVSRYDLCIFGSVNETDAQGSELVCTCGVNSISAFTRQPDQPHMLQRKLWPLTGFKSSHLSPFWLTG